MIVIGGVTEVSVNQSAIDHPQRVKIDVSRCRRTSKTQLSLNAFSASREMCWDTLTHLPPPWERGNTQVIG